MGYLSNINSDRKLISFCSDSLPIRLFLKYDIDEVLSWHSTISRTRQLYGESVFFEFFQQILQKCVSNGMVRGKRQAQHHDWKKGEYKDMPGHTDSSRVDENGNLIRPKFCK